MNSSLPGVLEPVGSLAGEHDPRLYNRDLAPTTAAQRTWGTYNYIALWFSMSMEVTTYMLASSLIAGGMNWKQAILTILLGNLIVLIPMLLNAHAGAKYGIPFPVFVRASFGTRGANLPAMLRAFVACNGPHALCLMGKLPRILAPQYVRGVARCRVDTVSAELFGAIHAGHVLYPVVLDVA